MKTSKFTNEVDYFRRSFDLPNAGLRAFYERQRVGQPDEYRTVFYKGRSLDRILGDWSKELEEIQSQWPSLLEFENDLRSKVGPMSIMLPLKDRIKDIDSYYDSILLESKPISNEAIQAVVSNWKPISGMGLRNQRYTLEEMKKSTNSGSPFFSNKQKVLTNGLFSVPCKCELYDEYYVKQSWRGEEWDTCAILGWRGQEGGPESDDVKQRVIWMFPFALNVCELSFYQPLIEHLQKLNLVPAWVSMDSVDDAITKLFDTKGHDDLVVCTDFSKFDQHFNRDMQDCCRTVYTQLGFDAEWLANIWPIKYVIPLAYDYGKVRFGYHGMASGSGGTNADETVTHKCLQYEAALAQGRYLNPGSQCLGDDGILSYPGCTVDQIVQTYTLHGQEMNLDKQYASTEDCVYLRRWHHRDYREHDICVGVYSTYRALGRLCELERWPKEFGPKMVALRQLSILENCNHHPLFERFVDYCMKGDKYRLGLDIPGFLDDITAIAKEATDDMPDFLGYTKALGKHNASYGIKKWRVVRYLKSKQSKA